MEPKVQVRHNRTKSSDQVFPDWTPPPVDEGQRRQNQARNQDQAVRQQELARQAIQVLQDYADQERARQDYATRGGAILKDKPELGTRSRQVRGEAKEAPFSRNFNVMAAAAHALAGNRDRQLTEAVTRDLVNDTRDGRAQQMLKCEIGEALLTSNSEDPLQTLPVLDPTLAKVKGADNNVMKQLEKAIAYLPAGERHLKEKGNWRPLLSLVITWANRHQLSFEQVRDVLQHQTSGDAIFKLTIQNYLEKPDLAAALQRLERRCKSVTPSELRRRIKEWRLDCDDIGGSIHNLIMLYETNYPGLDEDQIDQRVVSYLLESEKLPGQAARFVDQHQATYNRGEIPSLKRLQDLLITHYNQQRPEGGRRNQMVHQVMMTPAMPGHAVVASQPDMAMSCGQFGHIQPAVNPLHAATGSPGEGQGDLPNPGGQGPM